MDSCNRNKIRFIFYFDKLVLIIILFEIGLIISVFDYMEKIVEFFRMFLKKCRFFKFVVVEGEDLKVRS